VPSEPEIDDSPTRRWPFGVAQTVVLLLVCGLVGGAFGWALGSRDHPESFNDVDAGFLEDMIVHHNGAVTLGLEYLPRQNDSVVAHFAREIVTTQSAEIAAMNLLVDDAGRPAIATNGVAMEWMGDPMDPVDMPGMATDDDFARLRAASGTTADDVFTRLMIRHHEAGIAMATRAAAEGENPRVRRLARAMATVQRTEVEEMNRRRVALGLAALDPWDPSTDAPSHEH
jgi:uncharacterized protein (DUF305 family)